MKAQCIILSWTAALLAQEVREPWRVVRELRVTGAVAVQRDELVSALMADPRVMRLLVAPFDAAAFEKLAGAAQDVYRRNGFAQARVSWDRDEHSIRVDEGSRRTCGEIVCEGNREVTTANLRAALHAASKLFGDEKTGWRDGEPAPADDFALRAVRQAMQRAYVDRGYHNALIEVSPVLRDAVMDLHVVVKDEGRPTVVRRIALRGDDDAEAALARLRWQPGALLTRELADDLEAQLNDQGRYQTIAFVLPEKMPIELDPLIVAVRVLPCAPRLAEFEHADVVQIRRALQRVVEHIDSGRLIAMGGDLHASQWRGVQIDPGRVELRVSRGGFAIGLPSLRFKDGPDLPLELLVSPEWIGIAAGANSFRFGLPQPMAFTFTVRSSFGANGRCEVRWGAGVSAGDHPGAIDVTLHPATASYIRYSDPDLIRREGEDLIVAGRAVSLRIGPDGEWRSGSAIEVPDGDRESVAMLDITWEQLRADFLTRHPEPLEFFPAFVSRVARVLPPMGFEASGNILELISSAVQVGGAEALPRRAPAERLRSLGGLQVESAPPMNEFARLLLGWAARVEVCGWPRDLCGVAGTLMLGRSDVAGLCVSAYAHDAGHGPVAMLAGAAVLGLLGAEEVSLAMLRLAEERWSFAAAYDDVAAACAGMADAAALPRLVGARWRAEARFAALFADLPAGPDGDLAAWRKGLEVIWNGGGGEWLKQVLFAAFEDR